MGSGEVPQKKVGSIGSTVLIQLDTNKQTGKDVVNTYSISISQDVSIQVQSVCYQSQTGHDPHVYNPMTIFNATIHGASWLAIDVNIDNRNQF